ncbi:hypothetical protein CBR_g48509 [Chara braunii]|uniref:Core Histone H2A/H2B/H3 domain-containing protein n=1 Tax=Chara braunii TaxID=69332 RepID=A0A388M2U0_CHABU|nr:hypothetical protein CBR_g48509 [Chara braunii]|eukprot:GBG88897.1 hypothetical protein CBR_g48509 [Chara braunii]
METEDILKGFADGSKEGNSAGGNTADCAEVLATIYAQTAEMIGDGDETENDAQGSTCKTEKVGEEREEGGLGSRESLTGCIVKDENVVKTSAGEEYPCDINWVPARVQPGIVGGTPCFSVLRLNDAATPQEKGRYALKMWRVLEAQGEFRLNDFLYDSFDCGQSWVIGGNDATGSTACHESDARRDPRWGWVPCAIPIPCGRVRMMMRDAMGNVWSTHYVNGNFSFRNLDREVSEDEKKAMACPTHTDGCFFPPLRNPVELEVVEGKLFIGEDGSAYMHARGQEAKYDGLCSQIWDHVTMRSNVLSAMDIGAHVVPEGQLQQHIAPENIVEHCQFLVVLARVSIFNVNVKDHVLVVEHAKRCWEKIREEERQMVCAGYDSMADQGMWSMVEGSCTGQEQGDGQNRYMAHIRRRHGCTTVLGWVPVVCPMTYEHGGDVTMRFRDPLGVPFHLTYLDGLLRDIRYLAENDLAGSAQVHELRSSRPGMATLAEIRKLQRSTDLCLAFRPFLRLVREVVDEDIALFMGVRFQMTAVSALMEAVEAYLVANFENTNKVAIHSKRVTIQVRDMRLVDWLSKPRWGEKYQGMLDEKARGEERQQRMEARQAERDGSRAGAKKRKVVLRKGGRGKKRQLENSTVCAA